MKKGRGKEGMRESVKEGKGGRAKKGRGKALKRVREKERMWGRVKKGKEKEGMKERV